MNSNSYKRTVVSSVSGHCRLEQIDVDRQNIGRRNLFNSKRINLPAKIDCRAGWCKECAGFYGPGDIDNPLAIKNCCRYTAQQRTMQPVSQALDNELHGSNCGRKGRPSPLTGSKKSHRSRRVTSEHGVSVWIPGAHRSPTGKTQCAPPRTPQHLSCCDHHGRVDARHVDMTCNRCREICLDESTVPPKSDLVTSHSVPAFSPESYEYAAEGKCSCEILQGVFCLPCEARAEIAMLTSGRVGSRWEWL